MTGQELEQKQLDDLQSRFVDLLKETQSQAAKMREQEDSLRMNLEEIRATQEESERREAELRGYVEAIDNAAACVEFAPDGTILRVNGNFLRTFGYEADEVVGKPLSILYFEGEQDKCGNLLAAVGRGKTVSDEDRRRSKTGINVYLRSTCTPVVSYDGEVEKVISIGFDISDEIERMRDNNNKIL